MECKNKLPAIFYLEKGVKQLGNFGIGEFRN